MRGYNNKRFNLVIAVLAGIFLLAAIGAKQHFSSKKILACEDNNIELTVGIDAEEDGDNGHGFDLALTPGGFIYLVIKPEIRPFGLSGTKHTKKQLSEARLYILFHHLRSHIG